MRFLSACCLILGLLTLPGSAQNVDPAAQRILLEDARINEQIRVLSQAGEAARYGPFYCNELVINQHDRPWPAVGIHHIVYRFYYDREEGESGGGPRVWPDRLRKVVVKMQVSARSGHFEFLSDRQGNLMLYRRQIQDEDGLQLVLVDGRSLGSKANPSAEKEALRSAAAVQKLFLESMAASPEL